MQTLRHRYHERRADVLLVSFPKSGRTWLRAMLGRALQQHYGADEALFMKTWALCRLDKRIPYIFPTHDDHPQDKEPSQISRDKGKYACKRVIFLVRDPRDVMVSLFFHKKYRRRPEIAYQDDLSNYVYEMVGGVASIVTFYNIWAGNRHVPHDFLLIKYEDIIDDPERELRRVLRFLEIDWLADATLAEAVQFASFENLRKIEVDNTLSHGSLRTRDRDHADSYKVRRGKIGGYVDYLDAREIAYLDEVICGSLSDYLSCYK